MTSFIPLTVSQIIHDTRDALVVEFEVLPAYESAFAFKAGQYVTLCVQIDGESVRRSYSICSAEHERLRVGIKRVEGGVFSNWVHQHLRVGDSVQVMPPQGRFGQAAAHARHALLIAAGSGITPVLSILKTGLQSSIDKSFTLFYGNRATSSVMFREELMQLKDRFMTRLNIVYVMSREPQDFDLLHGRMDKEKCASLLDQWVNVGMFDEAFICGPQQLMLDAKAALIERGMQESHIHAELFAVADKGLTRKTVACASHAGQAAACQVTLVMDGHTQHFSMLQGQESLLQAGLRAGVDMRYSCKGGVCSTCRAKVISGQVEMDVNYALEDYEVRRGFVLTCQSYAVSDTLVIDFDQDT